MFGRVLERLDELERIVQGAPEGDGTHLQPIDSARLGVPPMAPEAAAIDTLALIFEAIFTMPHLPDPIKMVLASLQIPTLRAALLDPHFFTADAHPARQLIDKVARAGIGLPADVSSRHPLCTIIAQIAGRVRTGFTGDTAVLMQAVGELEKLIVRRDNAAGQAAAGYRPLQQQMEQGDLAEQRARQVIDEFCMRPEMPAEIAGFLREHWQRVLRQAWLEGGVEGADWRDYLAVAEKLLWSVTPKSEADARKQLARELPPMLEKLTAGMQRIGLPDAARAEFLDTCFRLQTTAMRGIDSGSHDVALRTPAAARPAPRATVSELRSGAHLLRIYDYPGGARRTARYRRSNLRNGDWLVFCMEDEAPICGRICQISKVTGKLLLANPDWEFAVILHPGVVNDQLREGRASLVSRLGLFNAAAEQALAAGGQATSPGELP